MMNTWIRTMAPALIAVALAFPTQWAQACDGKACAHHAEGKTCDCSCGSKHEEAAQAQGDAAQGEGDQSKAKAHKCGKKNCKKAKCDGKGCCQKHAPKAQDAEPAKN